MNQAQARHQALLLANIASHLTSEEIIARAQAFQEFLTGKPTAEVLKRRIDKIGPKRRPKKKS